MDTNLKKIRKSKKISQRKLAELAGLKPRQVEYWEFASGRFNKATLDMAVAVAKVLECDVEDLMDPKGEDHA